MKPSLNKERNEIMRSFPIACSCLILSLLATGTWLPASCAAAESEGDTGTLKLGWASADITPDRPVVITGGSAARVSEGVADHIYATALALESTGNNDTAEMVIMVSLDLVGVTDILYSRTATHWLLARAWRTLERYELQKTVSTLPVKVHVVRIGDMALATNPFELYLDYGSQIKARSKAVQTFVVELASPGGGGYLPTQRSVQGGAYGPIPQSTLIGPEGGRVLVNRTLELIESLWDEEIKRP
jgi:hypothetical protein